jgi:cytochrome c biogenesis protein CcmG/thiol:disulfide interchange protein DsbE
MNKLFLFLVFSFSLASSQTETDTVVNKIKIDSLENKIKYEEIYDGINQKSKRQFLGKEIPFFKVKDLDGIEFDSSKTKRLVFYNFWFSGCAPCVLETDMLNNLQSKFKDQVDFVSLTFDSKESVGEFIKKHPFNFRHLSVSKEFLTNLDINGGYPTSVLVLDGKIIKYRLGGPSDLESLTSKLGLFGTYYKFRSAIEQALVTFK